MLDGQAAIDAGIGPGQVWLIEQDAAGAISAGDRDVLTAANVILYDRALAPLVAEILPLGTYAEPLSREACLFGPAIAPRGLQFAGDGWSVVQIVEAGAAWRRRLRESAEMLSPPPPRSDLRLRLIAKGGESIGMPRDVDAAGEFLELFDAFAKDEPLTLVLGPLTHRAPAAGAAFTANGLAG
ncbi:MAG: hypothetical protein ACM3JG_10350 [Thiohalocapsa sp.]